MTRSRWSLRLQLAPIAALSAVLLPLAAVLPAATSAPATHRSSTTLVRALAPPRALRIERDGDRLTRMAPRRSLADFVRGFVRHGDVGALSDAFRAFVREHWAIALPSPELSAVPLPIGGPPGTLRYGLGGGDLDRDGLADTLDVEVDFATFHLVSLTGRRGTDARRLWSRAYDDGIEAVPLPAGDLTGDRAADVLLVRFDAKDGVGAGPCAVAGCFEAGHISYAWTFSLLSGRSGSAVWTKTYDGEATIGGASVNQDETIAVHGTNVLVLAFLSGDHDGDGRRDVVLDALDVAAIQTRAAAGTGDFRADADASHPLVATRAEVASGRSGKTIFARTQGLTPGFPILLPAGDAVGDGHTDLLWETSTWVDPAACGGRAEDVVCADGERGRLDLELLDGATLASSWKASIGGTDLRYAFALPADVDLSRDGKADLLLTEKRAGFRLGVVSGATGRVLWSRPTDPDAAVDSIGEGRRGGGYDLLVSLFVVVSEPTEQKPQTPVRVELHLDRVEGSTGRLRLATVRTFAERRARSIQVIESYVFGDGNRDGVADIAVDRLDRDDDINDLVSSAFVESGRTGTRLWTRFARGFGITQPAGQATSSGASGILDFRLGEDDLVLSLVDVERARMVWSRTDPVPDGILSVTSPDQSGEGGDDAIFSRLVLTPRAVFSRIDGVEARTGARAWGTGQSLPLRPRGKIAGTVRDSAGGVLADMCVAAFKLDATRAGLSSTTTKGTYRIGRLATGRYKVEFFDCTSGGRATRWYKQKHDFRSAQIVVVTDGRTTMSIDAVLPRG